MSKNRRKNNGTHDAVLGKRYSLDESIYNGIIAVLDGYQANHVPLDIVTKAVDKVYSNYHRAEPKSKPEIDKAKLNAACNKIDEIFHNYAKVEIDLARSESRPVNMTNLASIAKRMVNAYMKDVKGLNTDKVEVTVVRDDDGFISLNVNIPRDDE